MNKEEKYKRAQRYTALSGSRLYGTEHSGSDYDIRGFFVPSRQDLLSPFDTKSGRVMRSEKVHLDAVGTKRDASRNYDVCVHDIRTMFTLWAKGSPEQLELLMGIPKARNLELDHSSIPEEALVFLWCNRRQFLSKKLLGSHRGFINQCMSDMRKYNGLEEDYKVKKLASTAVRLGLQATALLAVGDFDPEENREILRPIVFGQASFDEVMDLVDRNQKKLNLLAKKNPIELPDAPDYEILESVYCKFLRKCDVSS